MSLMPMMLTLENSRRDSGSSILKSVMLHTIAVHAKVGCVVIYLVPFDLIHEHLRS